MTNEPIRKPTHDILPAMFERWSPRSFTAEAIPDEVLRHCFEAARWAPSALNYQPWRFVYAHRASPEWQKFLSILHENNRNWAHKASALMFVLSKTAFTGTPNTNPSMVHSFDAGAAWQNFALQAATLGWFTHPMGGIDREAAYSLLKIPRDLWYINCAVVIGKRGRVEDLPEAYRAREVPTGRVAVEYILMEDGFVPEKADFPPGIPGSFVQNNLSGRKPTQG